MDKQELAPPESSSSSSNYYFTQQALRAGYLKPGDLDSASRRDLREAILKEIEKERIREEIIAAQIAELRRRTRSDVSFPNIPSSLTATVTEERAGEMSVEERLGRMVAIKHGIPLFETPTFHGPRF